MDLNFLTNKSFCGNRLAVFWTTVRPPVRKVLDGDAEYDAELWQKVVEMGWTATVIPKIWWLGLSSN